MSLLWSSNRLTVTSPVEPVLLVALLGFDPFDEPELAQLLQQCRALSAQWRVGPPSAADLWIVNGAATHALDGDMIEVGGDAPLKFRPGDIACPVAFTEPVAPDLEARFRFHAASLSSLTTVLTRLAPWLSPKIAQQALVGHLIANGVAFKRSTVIHVQDESRLLAVMDFGGDTGVATDATPAALRRADWHLRPPNAGFVPSIFQRSSTEDVLWRFATHAAALELLPARYRRLPIHLRRVPTVSAGLLQPRQQRIVDALAGGPLTFRELMPFVLGAESQLQADLGALYLIGGITCDPMRSLALAQRRRNMQLAPDAGDLSSPASLPRAA
jgi:hypothetical protein